MRNCSERELPAFLAAHVSPTLRAWVRWYARGSDTSHVGPMACAWAAPPRTAASPPANGGNCTNRGATRRRHAEGRLLMVQNPHRQPEIHPGAEGGGSGEHGRASRHWASHGTRGRRPDNLQTNFARNFPRSLFETTRKRCNSNDVDSTFEVNAWELRATLMGGAGTGRALRRHAGDTPRGGF